MGTNKKRIPGGRGETLIFNGLHLANAWKHLQGGKEGIHHNSGQCKTLRKWAVGNDTPN